MMENESSNRMEKVFESRKPYPLTKDLFPDNKELNAAFRILKTDYGFTPDMIWRISKILHTLKKQGHI